MHSEVIPSRIGYLEAEGGLLPPLFVSPLSGQACFHISYHAICLIYINNEKEPHFVSEAKPMSYKMGIWTESTDYKLMFIEEPCFVLDPEGERLQNRHPDRIDRV